MANNTETVELWQYLIDEYGFDANDPVVMKLIADIDLQAKALAQQEANRQKLELLDELEKQSIYGHLAVPDNTQFVPLSAIEQVRKEME